MRSSAYTSDCTLWVGVNEKPLLACFRSRSSIIGSMKNSQFSGDSVSPCRVPLSMSMSAVRPPTVSTLVVLPAHSSAMRRRKVGGSPALS